MDGDDEASVLGARVEAGTLHRAALELLEGVDDRAASRALRKLPLVLTSAAPEPTPEPGAPFHAEGWLRWAVQLETLGRVRAARVVLAACELASAVLASEEPSKRSELVGLHTGPWGVLDVTPEAAAELAPFERLSDRVREAVRRWIAEPSEARRAAVAATWPAAMSTRARVELLAELAEVDARALWALRWMVVLVTEDGSIAQAAGSALAEAQSAIGERGPVVDVVRAVLRELLIA